MTYRRPEEIDLVQTALRDALGQRLIFLKPLGPAEWRLSALRAPDPYDASPPVVQFSTVAEWIYWLSAQLKFNFALGELRFLSASLTVSRSSLVSDEKKNMLRAEWEHRDGAEYRKHGQPHWHVYVSDLAQWELERFHLAMAACWHLGEVGSHFREPSPQRVARWVGECVKYIKGQLASRQG